MKNRVHRVFGLMVCLFLLISCNQNRIQDSVDCVHETTLALNTNHPKGADLSAIVDKYIAKGLPGINVLISDDQGIWMTSKGMADIEAQIPMELCHINKLGSVTKMMIGALVWQLIEEGALAINDPINQYIPEVAEKLANGDEITLAMLINHTSGVYDIATDLNYNLAVVNDFSRSWTSDQIIAFVDGKPATHFPGDSLRYSNTNTMLTSLIIEAATGEKHGDLLQSKIFDKLGMENTYYYDYSDDFPSNRLAQGYLDFYNDGSGIQNISQLNPGSGNGYTGVYSTVEDLYLFMNALLREESLVNSNFLLDIGNSYRISENGTWASSIGGIHDEYLLLLPEGVNAYGHAGGDIGYSANLSYLPHNNTIFAGTYNYGTNLPTELGEVLHDMRDEIYLLLAE